MKKRLMFVAFLVLTISIASGAFRYGGGGSYLAYQKFDLTGINTILAEQGFPQLKEDGFGYGGFGYGKVSGDIIVGGGGMEISLKGTKGNKVSNIKIESGGLYLAKQINFSDKFNMKIGSILGGLDKILVIQEITDDPFLNREYSIIIESNFLFNPVVDLEYMITSFMSLQVGVGKSFLVNHGEPTLDTIKYGKMPELYLRLGFGF